MTIPCEMPISGKCKIAFVGEAPGTDEEALGRPFVGRAGRMYNKLLRYAGIERTECLTTNVFDFKLPDNDIKSLCVTQKEADKDDQWPQLQVPIDRGAYVPASIAVPQLTRLTNELESTSPNVVVALGGSVVWALLALSPFGSMKKMRGTVHWNGSNKVLVTYHPAYLMRKYHMLPFVMADFAKARRESAYPEMRQPKIDILIPKYAHQVEQFLEKLGSPAAVDIETLKGQIDNIGFADSFERAMSVPIFRPDEGANRPLPNSLRMVKDFNYWETENAEVRVMWAIAKYLQDRTREKIFQNGSYDVQWIWEKWGIATRNWKHDTRLIHHALWPELPKDLGTMAATHLPAMPAWKLAGAGRATTKKED